jgi:hypothetical protein
VYLVHYETAAASRPPDEGPVNRRACGLMRADMLSHLHRQLAQALEEHGGGKSHPLTSNLNHLRVLRVAVRGFVRKLE